MTINFKLYFLREIFSLNRKSWTLKKRKKKRFVDAGNFKTISDFCSVFDLAATLKVNFRINALRSFESVHETRRKFVIFNLRVLNNSPLEQRHQLLNRQTSVFFFSFLLKLANGRLLLSYISLVESLPANIE